MNRFLLLLLVLAASCGPTAKCTTANCTGCCDQKTDQCLAGSEATACGKGGTLCIACPATDECKTTRACGAKVLGADGGVLCNRSNWDGCCDDTGSCFTGTSHEVCGAAAASCAVCGSAQTCQRVDSLSPFGGRCVP